MDSVAAMEVAFYDGVDVISFSLNRSGIDFFDNNIAIGEFRAIENDIFVSAATRNYGPEFCTVVLRGYCGCKHH